MPLTELVPFEIGLRIVCCTRLQMRDICKKLNVEYSEEAGANCGKSGNIVTVSENAEDEEYGVLFDGEEDPVLLPRAAISVHPVVVKNRGLFAGSHRRAGASFGGKYLKGIAVRTQRKEEEEARLLKEAKKILEDKDPDEARNLIPQVMVHLSVKEGALSGFLEALKSLVQEHESSRNTGQGKQFGQSNVGTLKHKIQTLSPMKTGASSAALRRGLDLEAKQKAEAVVTPRILSIILKDMASHSTRELGDAIDAMKTQTLVGRERKSFDAVKEEYNFRIKEEQKTLERRQQARKIQANEQAKYQQQNTRGYEEIVRHDVPQRDELMDRPRTPEEGKRKPDNPTLSSPTAW